MWSYSTNAKRQLSRFELRRRPVPPSVAELNTARAAVAAADLARDEAIGERDAIVSKHSNLVARWQGDAIRVSAERETRDRDLADARAAGVTEGVAQGDQAVKTAVEQLAAVERQAAEDVERAEKRGFERGRSERGSDLQAVRTEVERLTADLALVRSERDAIQEDRDAVQQERDDLVDRLGRVKATRDELWAERTAGRTDATPVRPASTRRTVTHGSGVVIEHDNDGRVDVAPPGSTRTSRWA